MTIGQATGSIQLGTVVTDKIGVFGTTPAIQQAHITDAPAGGSGATAGAYDSSAHRDTMIAAVNAIIAALETYGILAAS